MDSVKFELTIKKFFEKAGVILLKKGVDYTGGDDTASFILLDEKRKSFYLAETDIPDDTDLEINAATESLPSNIPENAKAAILRLGRTVKNGATPELQSHSIAGLLKKSALIISEDCATQVTTFLNTENTAFQSVPFKGAFMVYFIDDANSQKLVAVYNAATETLKNSQPLYAEPLYAEPLQEEPLQEEPLQEEPLQEEPQEDALPTDQPFSFDNLISTVPPVEEEEEKQKNEHIEPIDKIEDFDIDEKDILKDIESIDLRKLISPPPMEKMPETQEEADLMYAKILNEQTSAHEVSLAGPRKRNLNDIPADIFASEHEKDEPDNDTPVRKPERKAGKKQASISGLKGAAARKIAANASGFVFFTPAFLIGKAVSRFFPPFVIYWLAAIAVILGVYQYMWFIPGGMLYGAVLGTASSQATLLLELSPAATSNGGADMAGSILAFSGIALTGLVKLMGALESGWLLRYLAAFGAVLMIFPYGRAFGARIVTFSILFYFFAPLQILVQSIAINSAVAALPTQADALIGAAATVLAAIVFIPLVSVVMLFIIAGWLLPFRDNQDEEVLP